MPVEYALLTEAALDWFPEAWATPEKKRKLRLSTENVLESDTLHM